MLSCKFFTLTTSKKSSSSCNKFCSLNHNNIWFILVTYSSLFMRFNTIVMYQKQIKPQTLG